MPWMELRSHQQVLEQLRRALSRGRMGHSFLFVGSEGVGKKRVAQHVAQGLLCEQNPPPLLSPCGHCGGCKQVENDSHPDFFSVAKPEDMNDLPIESIRDLCDRLSLKPARGGYKIAIVDDADYLNEASANCFLKTLEEPPSSSILILIATSLETQLATIVSRCQVLRFSDLPREDVAGLLKQIRPELIDAEVARLADWSGGSIARALELSGQHWQEIRRVLFDGLSRQPVRAVALADAAVEFVEEAGTQAAVKRTRARQLIALVTDFYRKCLFYQQSGQWDHVTEETRLAICGVAENCSPDIIVDLIDRCLHADYHLARSLHQQLALECWMDDLAQISSGQYVPAVGFQ